MAPTTNPVSTNTPFPNEIQKIYQIGTFTFSGAPSSSVIPQASYSFYNVLAVVNTLTSSLYVEGTTNAFSGSQATWFNLNTGPGVNTAAGPLICPSQSITPFTLYPVDGIQLSISPNPTIASTVSSSQVTTNIVLMGQIDPTALRPLLV